MMVQSTGAPLPMSFFKRTALAAAFTLLAVNTSNAQTSPPAAPPDPAATSVEALG